MPPARPIGQITAPARHYSDIPALDAENWRLVVTCYRWERERVAWQPKPTKAVRYAGTQRNYFTGLRNHSLLVGLTATPREQVDTESCQAVIRHVAERQRRRRP